MVIDVSEHNGALDWEKLKPQIEGAIIRVGYGQNLKSQDDKQYARNLKECRRLGIPIGVYIYSYAKTTEAARSEAEHVNRLIKDVRLSMPVYFDIEEQSLRSVARSAYTAFKGAIKDGTRVGLYTGEYYYNSYLKGTAAGHLWIAKYGTNNGRPQTEPKLADGAKYELWQYTSKALGGHVDASKIIDRKIFGVSKTVAEIAAEVLDGKWRNGEERKKRLEAAGYSYEEIQEEVNRLSKRKSIDTIASEVIAGKWGNGADRVTRLELAGYDPAQVQRRVNELV